MDLNHSAHGARRSTPTSDEGGPGTSGDPLEDFQNTQQDFIRPRAAARARRRYVAAVAQGQGPTWWLVQGEEAQLHVDELSANTAPEVELIAAELAIWTRLCWIGFAIAAREWASATGVPKFEGDWASARCWFKRRLAFVDHWSIAIGVALGELLNALRATRRDGQTPAQRFAALDARLGLSTGTVEAAHVRALQGAV